MHDDIPLVVPEVNADALDAAVAEGGKRIIATVFGGTSTANRNARVAELLDMGFGKAPKNAPEVPPDAPVYADVPEEAPAEAPADLPMAAMEDGAEGGAGKTIRLVTTMATSPRPRARPTAADLAVAAVAAEATPPAGAPATDPGAAATEAAVLAMADGIEGAVAQATAPLPFTMAAVAPSNRCCAALPRTCSTWVRPVPATPSSC
jgi:D-alanyl-D-alanine carboxypeptidase